MGPEVLVYFLYFCLIDFLIGVQEAVLKAPCIGLAGLCKLKASCGKVSRIPRYIFQIWMNILCTKPAQMQNESCGLDSQLWLKCFFCLLWYFQ